jgi:hypothetical protein
MASLDTLTVQLRFVAQEDDVVSWRMRIVHAVAILLNVPLVVEARIPPHRWQQLPDKSPHD